MNELPPRSEVADQLYLIMEARNERDWRHSAACKGMDPDVFFLRRDQGGRNAAAKAVCAGCPVSAECLEVGANELAGIWGGLSAQQRRQLGHSKTDFQIVYREWIRLTDPSQEMAAHDLGISSEAVRQYRQKLKRK